MAPMVSTATSRGVDFPGDHGLEGQHCLGCDDHRVPGPVGVCPVAGDPPDHRLKRVGTCGEDPGPGADGPGREDRVRVEGEGGLRDREPAEQTVVDHGPGPLPGLLGGLGHEEERPGPGAVLPCQQAGGPGKVRHVQVMAAGMHHRHSRPARESHIRGSVGEAGLLTDGEPVHVGPDHHHRPVATGEEPHHPGPSPGSGNPVTRSVQLCGEDPCRPHLGPGELGMPVQVPVERIQVREDPVAPFPEGHGDSRVRHHRSRPPGMAATGGIRIRVPLILHRTG